MVLFLRISRDLGLGLLLLAASAPSCGILSPPDDDPCKNVTYVSFEKTLYSDGPDSVREYFIHTGPAKSGCHASYTINFNRAGRLDRSHNADSLPFSTEHAFRPGGMQGLMFYFPSPAPVLITGDQTLPTWHIGFSIGNKNSSSDTTDYTFGIYLPSTAHDTIHIDGRIAFSVFYAVDHER